MLDEKNQQRLSEHCSIHTLELEKWQYSGTLNPEGQWLYFFKEAENWRELPEIINTPEMRQAMAVLERFSEKEDLALIVDHLKCNEQIPLVPELDK